MIPTVSVVIAARNEALFGEDAVKSILGQDGVDLELIFIDDNSTDDTLAIVKRIAADDRRMHVRANPKKGKCSAFNLGISLAKGKWVCIFSGDDIMPPGSLAARVAAVEAGPADRPVAGLCRIMTMSEDKRRDGQIVPRDPGRGSLSGSSYMMNRAALYRMWPVPEGLPNEDTWLEMAALYLDVELVHSSVVGCNWRIHSGNSVDRSGTFAEFNAKITPRNAALSMFLDQRGSELSDESRQLLRARIKCEEARKRGDLIGIMTSGASTVTRLRAVSMMNPIMFAIRKRAYKLFSGW